ncbi:hypothetical protein RYH80_09750 [Halobaculum sp. MBLA0147]|uniref:hypothetical protein n=1 Tax=Halobaculum sp. MBLA0147 TaxID=3079934 RepID=UPI003525214F
MTADESDGSSDTEIDILEIAREEAHRTIDQQVSTLNDIDTKAAKILRLNLILLSISLTGFSVVGSSRLSGITTGAPQSGSGFVVAGFVSILVSTALAALTYTASSMREGLSGRDLNSLLYGEYTDREKLYGIVDSYSEWAQVNFKTNTKNAPLGTATVSFLVYGIVCLAVGVYGILSSGVPLWMTFLVICALLIYTWRTGIVGQLRRYWRYRDLDPTED